MAYRSTPEERRRREARRRQRQAARGIGQQGDQPKKKARDRGSFWAGMLMGAATATGGFFAIKALERVFKKDQPHVNPAGGEATHRLMVSATTGAAPQALNPPKPPVVKRTIVEEMVEDLDG